MRGWEERRWGRGNEDMKGDERWKKGRRGEGEVERRGRGQEEKRRGDEK